jgi:hypothetical protein
MRRIAHLFRGAQTLLRLLLVLAHGSTHPRMLSYRERTTFAGIPKTERGRDQILRSVAPMPHAGSGRRENVGTRDLVDDLRLIARAVRALLR